MSLFSILHCFFLASRPTIISIGNRLLLFNWEERTNLNIAYNQFKISFSQILKCQNYRPFPIRLPCNCIYRHKDRVNTHRLKISLKDST
jgi:hypothetical protein